MPTFNNISIECSPKLFLFIGLGNDGLKNFPMGKRKKVGPDYNFEVYYPEIAKHWDYERNLNLRPSLISPYSNKSCWWICKKGHNIVQSPNAIKNGRWCKYCSNKAVCEDNNLLVRFPDVAMQWHPTKNKKLTPDKIVASSHKRVWLICSCGNDFERPVNLIKLNAKNEFSCKACSAKLSAKTRSVAKKGKSFGDSNGHLLKYWDYEKNKEHDPFKLKPSSSEIIYWRCKNGHSFKQAIYSTNYGKWCKYCANKAVSEDNCLANNYPEIAKEWHPTRNLNLTPNEVISGSGTKVWWLCDCGHEWRASVSGRTWSGCGCRICGYKRGGNRNRRDTERFINESTLIHNGFYDYSKSVYVSAKEFVIIICPVHGEFSQRAHSHAKGKGCKKCSIEYVTRLNLISKKEVKKRFSDAHGDNFKYNWSSYVDTRTNMEMFCKKHGSFNQKPCLHYNGHGCNKCSSIRGGLLRALDLSKVKKRFLKIHLTDYKYNWDSYVNFTVPMEIICKKHGSFFQKPQNHYKGCGCPGCSNSKGENKVRRYLKKNNIEFICEKRFYNCRNIISLPFDFYLPDFDALIEYQGEQHYEPVNHFGGEKGFEKRKKRDKIKKDFAMNNGFIFIEIPYWDFKNIEPILTTELNKIKSSFKLGIKVFKNDYSQGSQLTLF